MPLTFLAYRTFQQRKMSRSGYHQTDVLPPKVRRDSPLMVFIALGLALICLACYMAPILFAVGSRGDTAKVSAARSDLKVLAEALESYKLDVGKYPSTSEGIDALVKSPRGAKGWRGPYLRKPHITDPWGQLYVYQAGRVLSYGQDGRLGGNGVDAEIANPLP